MNCAIGQRNRVFTESLGFGEVFSQKPGFWVPVIIQINRVFIYRYPFHLSAVVKKCEIPLPNKIQTRQRHPPILTNQWQIQV